MAMDFFSIKLIYVLKGIHNTIYLLTFLIRYDCEHLQIMIILFH